MKLHIKYDDKHTWTDISVADAGRLDGALVRVKDEWRRIENIHYVLTENGLHLSGSIE